jgi:predicted transposase/invertase (TIGR01784 family)
MSDQLQLPVTSLAIFTGNIKPVELRIGDKNIGPKVREEWKMQLIPIDEAVREIQIRDAKEEGMETGIEEGKFEVARSMLADGLDTKIIRKYTGLDEGSILSLR